MTRDGKNLKNRILATVLAVVMTFMLLPGCNSTVESSLALEQSVRCGTEEHLHSEECYIGDILICGKKAHVHGENCYIVLLEDNDINRLLSSIDMAEGKSLESVIRGSISGAVNLDYASGSRPTGEDASADEGASDTSTGSTDTGGNSGASSGTAAGDTGAETGGATIPEGSVSVTPEPIPEAAPEETPEGSVPVTLEPIDTGVGDTADDEENGAAVDVAAVFNSGSADISALNEAIGTSGGGTLVLNENLNTTASANDSTTQSQVMNYLATGDAATYALGSDTSTSGDDYGVSTLAVGDVSIGDSTSNRPIYIEIFIVSDTDPNVGEWVRVSNSLIYDVTFSYDIWNYCRTASPNDVDNTITAINNEIENYKLLYESGNSWVEVGSYTSWNVTYTTFGTCSRNSTGSITARLYETDGTTPMKFAVITYADENGDETNEIVLINSTHEVKSPTTGYVWQGSDGSTYSGGETVTVSKSMTFTAVADEITVTFNSNGGTAVDQQTVEHGKTATKPTDPTKTGYTFTGWYTDAGCTNAYNFSTAVTSDITLYAGWQQFTATFVDTGGNKIADSISGGPTDGKLAITFPSLAGTAFDGYIWIVKDGGSTAWYASDGKATGNITANTTFVAVPSHYTVAFDSNGGSSVENQTIHYGTVATEPTDPTKTGYTFTGWYTDAGCTDAYNFSTAVTSNITLYAGWKSVECTVKLSYTDLNGNTQTDTATVDYGKTYTLPEGYTWSDGTSTYSGGTELTVKENLEFTGTLNTYTVTYIDENGNTTTSTVKHGASVTLPNITTDGLVWYDGANTHNEGDTVTITADTTFTASGTITVTYDVNFPTGYSFTHAPNSDQYTKPTLLGTDATELTDTFASGSGIVVRDVSEREVVAPTGHSASFDYVYHFVGWQTSTGVLIEANSNVTWNELQSYVDGGTVELTGVWSHGASNVANFCIRYDSVTGSGDYSASLYTPSLWASYVGNPDTSFIIEESNDDTKSYQNDQTIRAMYGESDGMWLYSFPSDEYIFEQLKKYASQLSVEGETVSVDKLDSKNYAIRWYVFKYVTSGGEDGWHIDGKLVKREGQITVDKVFGGIGDAVNKARDGFYILAENGYLDGNGNFVAYASDNAKYNTHILVLDEATKTALTATYPNAIFQIYNTQDVNSDGVVDEWLITDVELGEYWRFTEKAKVPTYTDTTTGQTKNYSWYAEYTVTDSDGSNSAIAKFGSTAQVIGKTYALDEDPDQGLRIDFTNYYYANDSILIRKIDGDTGQPLGGAEFQLWQGTQLIFEDNGNGVYTVSTKGTIDSITTNAEGFSVITIEGFSLEKGDLVVKEVTAPSGYDTVADITVGLNNGTAGIEAIGDSTDSSEFAYHAEYYDENGGVLVVKDHTMYYTSVTANKVWENPAYTADSVTVVLQTTVNGVTQNAGILFPNLTGHQQVLNAANNWTYTWTDLPAYANGEKVSWSIKEIKVGNDPTLADGVSFANWIVDYSLMSADDVNGDGIVDNWNYRVANSIRRTMLRITKTDTSGLALEGAEFQLVQVTRNGTGGWTETGTTLTGTSDNTGTITFDNLTSGLYYKLTETGPPDGYYSVLDPVYLTITGDGVIKQVFEQDGEIVSDAISSEYISYTTAYNITVINLPAEPLPEVGGGGTWKYTLSGSLLMAAAMLLMIYKNRRSRRKEDAPYV